MNSHSTRIQIVTDIEQAVKQGAQLNNICHSIGLHPRTYHRWVKPISNLQSPHQAMKVQADQRPTALRPSPKNALNEQERITMINICQQAEFQNLPPSQIVPKLADKGIYIASESSFYRVLKAFGQNNHRGRSKKPQAARAKPTSFSATSPNQVWTWDITYLPTRVKGQFLYLYCIQDLYSRKIVAREVHERESGQLAADLLEQAKYREGFKTGLVLHSDNGSPMTCQTMLAKMYQLGVQPSRSRPRVSNDNPYIESFFKTLKYTSKWPSSGFKQLEDARFWTLGFIRWYNEQHQHSAINYVTPHQRHLGQHLQILQQRKTLYSKARQANPHRWTGQTRNWEPHDLVQLNPDRLIENKQTAA